MTTIPRSCTSNQWRNTMTANSAVKADCWSGAARRSSSRLTFGVRRFMVTGHRKSDIVALVLAALPLTLVFSLPLLPWHGGHHPPDSIVYPNRAALLIAILFSIASLVLSVRVLRAKRRSTLTLLSVLLATGFLVWASPLAYGVVKAIVCGAC